MVSTQADIQTERRIHEASTVTRAPTAPLLERTLEVMLPLVADAAASSGESSSSVANRTKVTLGRGYFTNGALSAKNLSDLVFLVSNSSMALFFLSARS
jgi:hypothetical protein